MSNEAQFETDEILWYDNGKFGNAGYAVPNPAGKTWTNNSVIFQIHQLVGRNMFELMHRPDVKFYRPPHKQFWYDLHQLCVTARKRLADRMRKDNDSAGLVPAHATPTPQVFIVYPIPFFGERIRQLDVREYAQLGLMLLSELMQHSDNELSNYVRDDLAATAGKYLQEILALFATKYFGKTRVEAYAADFALADADFQAYDPSKVLTSVEMTEERPPIQWWPTENDLSQIRGLPINEALPLCKRWPATEWLARANGNVTLDRNAEAGSTGGGGQADGTGFVAPPGAAP